MRIAILVTCIMLLGCDRETVQNDASQIYYAALTELAPAVSEFMIVSEKATFGDNSFAPPVETLSEYGSFHFSDLTGSHSDGDFPMLDVTLVSIDELNKLDTDDCETYWKNFRSTYSRDSGYFQISDIGFSGDRKKAILYIQGNGGCTIGRGTLVVMTNDEGRWFVDREIELWVA